MDREQTNEIVLLIDPPMKLVDPKNLVEVKYNFGIDSTNDDRVRRHVPYSTRAASVMTTLCFSQNSLFWLLLYFRLAPMPST